MNAMICWLRSSTKKTRWVYPISGVRRQAQNPKSYTRTNTNHSEMDVSGIGKGACFAVLYVDFLFRIEGMNGARSSVISSWG